MNLAKMRIMATAYGLSSGAFQPPPMPMFRRQRSPGEPGSRTLRERRKALTKAQRRARRINQIGRAHV